MKPPAKNGNVLNTRHVLWAVLAAIILPSAAAQTATLSPAGLTFLTQVIGTTSAAQTATLTNTSSVSLTITSIQTTGDFSQTNNCGSSLAGGANCTINVTFTPTAMGSRTGTLSVNDNATPSPQTVSLSGSGTIVSLSPSTLSFGNVSVGIASAPQTITLTNVGASTLKVTGVSITGTNAGDFSQTNTCGSSVAAKASCTITVTFKPTAIGSRRATLNVSDNGGASPQTIALSGTGTSAAVLTSITVTPVNPSIAIGITQQFTATGNYSDGSTQNLTNSVTWTSANTSVATVQSTGTSHPGLATGVATGTTNIQATYTTISGSTQIIVGQLFVATPLMDLGTGTYLSFEGGLYENGTDQIPADHLSDGLGFVTDVQPRDTNGNPSPTGKFVFLSIGMSNANDEFQAFLLQAKKDSSVNTATQVIANGAAGSMQACAWVQPYGSPPCASVPLPNQYDRIRDHILAAVGLTEAQVEVVWIEDCDRDPGPTNYPPLCDPTVEGCTNTTQTEAIRYEQETGQILRAAKTRWPNLTLAFISSRIYGGYSATTVSPEPYAYEYGFSGKWAIQAQITQIRTGTVDVIAGDLSYGVAPWVAWSAYTWAAGPIPRSDGLIWCDGQTNAPCNGEIDFENDGMHADTTGQMKVGTMLMNFFTSSQVTTPWFLNP